MIQRLHRSTPVRLTTVLALLAGLWIALTPEVTAQGTVSITYPTASQVLQAGPDYATDVLGDAWDMNNLEDISKDPEQRRGWSPFSMAGGSVGGTTQLVFGQVGTSLTFLERAYYNVINPGRNGARYPINSGVYSKFSMKVLDSGRGDQYPQLYWFHNDLGQPGGDALGWRVVTNTPTTTPVPGGHSIQVADLNQMPSNQSAGQAWGAGAVRGLTLFPSNSAAGYNVRFDWVRITPGDGHPSAAIMPIQWSGGSGTSTIEVIDAAGTTFVVASGVSGTSFNWNYGVLPPGQYTLRITRGASAAANRTFSINAPPTLKITDPDETGGPDFATAVLGNPWDMNDGNDVRLEVPGNHLLQPSFSGGQFHAVADGVPVATSQDGIPVGDPIVYVLANNGVIDTTRYRYLTYTMQVDGNYDLLRGSVSRIFWGSTPGMPYSVTTSKDIFVWPGMNTYTIDLQSLTTGPNGGIEPTPGAQLWSAAGVRYLRIDPHEFAEQRGFHFDNVKLAAVDETTSGTFTIRWAAADANGDQTYVSLYYDTDLNPSSGLTAIASNIPGADAQYLWNTAGVNPGIYYIYATATDGLDTAGTYSTGPVRITTFTPVSDPLMNLESPANGGTYGQPFLISGWAVDRAAPTGTGVDAVHVYAYRSGTTTPIFLGSNYGSSRPDVGSALGSRFTPSGFAIPTEYLRPGSYQINAYARSTVTGTWNARVAVINVADGPIMALEQPTGGSTRQQPFTLSGWAIDTSAGSGTGVDGLQAWAYPNPGSGLPPVFVGAPTYGQSRTDVGAAYGSSRFDNSGYTLQVKGLPPGLYQIAVFAHSTATNSYSTWRTVTLTVQHNPLVVIDGPVAGTIARPFTVSGWAADLAAAGGTGVDAVQVWAYPTSGAAPVLVGNAAYGSPRPDVGSFFGAQFTNTGYQLGVSSLSPGSYDLVVFGHSTVSNAWDTWRIVRVNVQ